MTIPVDPGVSDLKAVDTTGSGPLDLVITNTLTGQVSVLLNLGNGTFGPPSPIAAGSGSPRSIPAPAPARPRDSEEATAGVASGSLTPGGPIEPSHDQSRISTLDMLAGKRGGGITNPMIVRTEQPRRSSAWRTSARRHHGLALLDNQVSIMLGNGKGGFGARHLRRRSRSHRPDDRRREWRRNTRPPGRQPVRRLVLLQGR